MEVFQRLNIGFSVGAIWLKRLRLTVVKDMVKRDGRGLIVIALPQVSVVLGFWTQGAWQATQQ